MSTTKRTGTLELIARELSKALLPLQTKLQVGNIQAFFRELGVSFPDDIQNQSAFTDALGDTILNVQLILPLITQLNDAIQNEDDVTIISTIFDIGIKIKDILNDLDTVSTQLDNLSASLPGITSNDIALLTTDFSKKLFDYLLIVYLEGYFPIFTDVNAFVGIIEYTEVQGDPLNDARVSFRRRELRLDRVAELISKPADLIKGIYGWNDDPNFDGNKLIRNIRNIVSHFGLLYRYGLPDGSTPSYLEVLHGTLSPREDLTPKGLEFSFVKELEGGYIYKTQNFIKNWHAEFDIDVTITPQTKVIIQPEGKITIIPPSGDVNGFLDFNIVGEPEAGEDRFILFGKSTGTQLSAERIIAGANLIFNWNSNAAQSEGTIGLKSEIEKGLFNIDTSEGDGFLTKILPNGIQAEFDFVFGWDGNQGFYFNGSSSLEVAFPIHKSLLGFEIEVLYIVFGVNNNDISIELSADTSFEKGPFKSVISRLGVLTILQAQAGNLGPLDAQLQFKPPTGIGLSIDSEAFKGGGFLAFDFQEERYIGAFELLVKDKISLAVIAILTTKLPGNADGYSLLLLVTAEFQPIQLGFGFTLNGVGGMIALNRTMDLQFLRDGVKAQTLDNVLFPDDPVANINQIISDLEGAFPTEEGRYVFGPMGIIGWGTPTLITLELGLMIEIPSPVRLAIVGVLKAILPSEEKDILKLQINFIGTIDFAAKFISFDASLYDSRLAVYGLSGDLAFRMKYGDKPNFLISIGGFHPKYTPPPMNLPALQRLTINLLAGDNPRMTLTTYFAITSNTVQFGAAIDFYYKVTKNIKVVGGLGFDLLIQFNPFYLLADISANLAVIRKEETLFGVFLSASAEGPAPWRVKGLASFKVVGVEFSVDFDETFGQQETTTLPDIEVLPLLEEALLAAENWLAEKPANSSLLVSLREVEVQTSEIVVHPNGRLAVSQKVVPLKMSIEKFGTQRPSDFNKFSIEIALVDPANPSNLIDFDKEYLKEFFAPAEYLELTNSEKLSRKSFEKMKSGVRIKGNDELSTSFFMERQLEYELSILDTRQQPIFFGYILEEAIPFQAWVLNNAVSKSNLGTKQKPFSANAAPKVQLIQEEYAIASIDDFTLYNGMELGSEAEANRILAELIESDPSLEDSLQVVPTFELD